ncbi:protein-tyrosine kinase 6-like [Astyanax mexicanus]|uniref:Tyrosine-protein kinase n=1 Tax=Astyanax mexicanus TaxID=7994 RepID=A0A8T2LII9_ASTMX|nr:protein-tyrosine kinase 6-like [Astyanax mexicanus]
MKGPEGEARCPCPSLQSLQTLLSSLFTQAEKKKEEEEEEGEAAEQRDGDSNSENPEIGTYNYTQPPTQPPTAQPADPPAARALYKALWSFQGRTVDELSFQTGDSFRMLQQEGEWCRVEKISPQGLIQAEGFVPSNYLAKEQTLEEQPWYFGSLNRLETQKLLLAAGNKVGAFLLRRSERDEVGCVLSVRLSDKEVKHFKVYEDEEGFYVDPDSTFPGLEQLVEHYKSHPLHTGECVLYPEPKPQDLSHNTVDDWELPKEEFALEEQLGSGFFADVYRGTWKGMVKVAVKILKNNDSLDHREFQLETQMLKKLRHRHLITLFAICTTNVPYYIITELMEKGNLLNVLRGQEGRNLEPHALTDMASQVADGMAYLEEKNSIHRDLAARNVLVGEDNLCKVADFGLARVIKEPFYLSEEKKIPYKWSAPEAISHGRFSNKSDVWSFGILLYEIFTYGGSPYPSHNNHEVFYLISSGYRMPAPPKCPPHIYDLMLKCWRESAEERPDFSEVLDYLENVSHYWTVSGNNCSDPAEGSKIEESREESVDQPE